MLVFVSVEDGARARIFDNDYEHRFTKHEQDFETMASKIATSKHRAHPQNAFNSFVRSIQFVFETSEIIIARNCRGD